MEIKTYVGYLSILDYGDSHNVLFISTEDEPFSEILEEEISCHTVTARYWITDKKATKEEALSSFVGQLSGVADSIFHTQYSEVTGYLWTDEEINIGGHDLLAELTSHVGKWLILEVEIHDDGESR